MCVCVYVCVCVCVCVCVWTERGGMMDPLTVLTRHLVAWPPDTRIHRALRIANL